MAIVPSQVQPISMDVASAYTPDNPTLGATARAIGAVGTDIANQSLQMLEQFKRAEAIDAASSAVFQDRYDSEDQMAKLKMRYPDGYVTDEGGKRKKNPDNTDRTITQEYRDWADKKYQDRQKNMPSLMAQQIYTQRAGEYYADSIQKVRNDELVLKTESFKRGTGSDLKYGLNRLVQTPSPNHAYQLLQDLQERNKAQEGVLLSAQQVHEANQLIQKEVPQSLFDGLINEALAEPKDSATRGQKVEYAMAVLNGQDRDSIRRKRQGMQTISESMDPDQKADVERRLIELGRLTEAMDRSDLDLKIRDAHSALELGQRVNIQPLINGLKGQLAKKKITSYEYADKIGGLIAADRTLAIFKDPDFILASPEVKQVKIQQAAERAYGAFIAELPPDEAKAFSQSGAGQRQAFIEKITRYGGQADSLARHDFVEFAKFDSAVNTNTKQVNLSNPQTLWKSGKALRSRTDRLYTLSRTYYGGNSPDFRVLSRSESSQLAGFLTDDKTSYQQAADGLVALRSSVGNAYYGVMIDQMIKDKHLGGEWRLALANPHPMLISDFVKTVRDGPKIREETTKIGKHSQEDFDEAVQAHAGTILLGMTQANSDSALAAEERRRIREVIATKAMSLSNASGGTMKPKEAAEMASKALLSSRYAAVSVGGGFSAGSRNVLLLPQWASEEQKGYAERNRGKLLSSEEALRAAGVAPPPRAKPEEAPVFYKQIMRTGRLTPTPDNTGYYLQYLDSNATGGWQNTFTGKTDRNGKPIPVVISTEQLLAKPSDPTTMESIWNFLGVKN